MTTPSTRRCACGYDLRGNTSNVCPECGRVATEAPAAEDVHSTKGAFVSYAASAPPVMPSMKGPFESNPSSASDVSPTSTASRGQAIVPPPPLNVPMLLTLISVAAFCLAMVGLLIIREAVIDSGWLLALTIGPIGLAAALYVARK